MPGLHYPSECHTVEYYECNEVFQITENEIREKFEELARDREYGLRLRREPADPEAYARYETQLAWVMYLSGAQMAIKKMGEKK